MLATGDIRICGNCGRTNVEQARFCQSCGSALGNTVPPPLSALPAQTATRYGGFWVRVLASIIDWCVVLAGLSALSTVSFGILFAPGILLPWVYEALMTSMDRQATVGKMVFGLVVVGPNGERLTFARATARHFSKYLSAAILGIGFIMAAFTAGKRALHDVIAETHVVFERR